MPTPPDYLVDGDFSRPVPVGPPRISYPFIQNKDRVSAVLEQDFWQTFETWTPADLSTPLSVAQPDFYLVAESAPVRFMANLVSFTRTFARVPVPQVTFSTLALNKPQPSGLGTSVGTVTDYTASDTASILSTAYKYPDALTVFGQNKVYARKAAVTSQTVPTSGTFTITYKTSTTGALAYNAADATIAAAINALADVVTDGITVSATNTLGTAGVGRLQIVLTVGTTASRFTANGASLGPAAAQTLFTWITSATSQYLTIARRATVTNHGFSTSLALLCASSSDSSQTLLPYSTHWLSIDANTVAIDAELATSNSAYLGQYLRDYTPGVDRVRSRITDTYYLPGVSSGITTATDIPLPSTAANDALLLTLVASSSTGYQAYDAQPLALWAGQIYHQAVVAIDLADL